MDQLKNKSTMKDRLMALSEDSDRPTVTYITPKAICFYASAVIAVVCMFMNWLSLDLDLGYLQLHDILGTLNVFTLPGGIGEIKDALAGFSMFLPDGVMQGISAARFAGVVLMAVSIASIACYTYAAFLRIKEDDNCAKFGKLAALLAVLTVVGFVALIVVILNAIDASAAVGEILGKILTGPCVITLVAALVSAYCAVMDMAFKENVVIYHDGRLKIDNGPEWKCEKCGKKNLSLLERCYNCGAARKE